MLRARRGATKATRADEVAWEVATGGLAMGDQPITAVVHLAGESLAGGRWTRRRRAAIWSSRVDATAALATSLARGPHLPRTFIHASGVGYYGDNDTRAIDEDSPRGAGFLADLAAAWEASAEPLRQAGVRVVSARLGMVLSREGGALAAMRLPFRLGLGGRVGSGRQGVSWITCDDAVRAMCWLASPAASAVGGPVNLSSPGPVSQAVFASTLARVLHRPALLPAPAWALRLVLGELADELLLSGQFAMPRKLLQCGFRFEDPDLELALTRVLGCGATG